MFGVQDALAAPAQTTQPDAFVIHRLNSKWITGRWDRTLLRDIGVQALLLLVVAGLAVLIYPFALRDAVDEIRMQFMNRQTTTGDVVDYQTSRCGKNNRSTCYSITYSYYVNDQRYTRTDTVDFSTYNTYTAEPRVPVTYALEDPSAAHLGSVGFQSQRIALGATFVALALVLVVVPSFVPIMDWFKTRRYRRNGQLITGRVVQAYGAYTGRGKYRRFIATVHYAFATPQGRTIEASKSRRRSDLGRRALPEPGTPCAVLYVNDADHLLL
jgi:hypothetical protein